jgi:hypothetical protein
MHGFADAVSYADDPTQPHADGNTDPATAYRYPHRHAFGHSHSHRDRCTADPNSKAQAAHEHADTRRRI